MTDGRRRRGFALALLVALTGLFLAPAVAFAEYIDSGYTWATKPDPFPTNSGGAYSMAIAGANRGGDVRGAFCLTDYPAGTISPLSDPVDFCNQGVQTQPGKDWYGSVIPFSYAVNGVAYNAGGYRLYDTGEVSPTGQDVLWGGFWDATTGTLLAVWGSGPDTSAPTAPTVTITAAGEDVTASFSGSTDNVGVTGYRYRWDGQTTWTTWNPPLAAPTAPDKAAVHSVEVQARDAAGNWSTSGTDSWGGCTVDSTEGCEGWGTGGEGDFGAGEEGGDCPWVNSAAHCLDWSTARPELADPAPNRWTFGVKDKGYAIATSSTYIVGWTCSGAPPVEGWASWHAMQERRFEVDCPEGEAVENFYVLGGGTLSEPDYLDVVLWWGYYRPGTTSDGTWDGTTGEVGDCSGADSCQTYNYVQPAPTTTPNPTRTAPAPAPVEGVNSPSAGCGFSITDPSSWAGAAMCEVARLLRRVVDAIGSVLSFLRGIPGWFVPRGAVLKAQFATVDTAWDNSAVGTLTGAVGDVAAPITGLEDTTTSCEGPLITMPGLGGSAGFTMHPFSACSSLAQYILGVVMPLERALVYLAGFFVALRIVSRTVGLDGPDQSEARAA